MTSQPSPPRSDRSCVQVSPFMSKYHWNKNIERSATKRAVPASTRKNVCSSAACARIIGSAAASRPAKRASDLALPAGRIEHGRPYHLFRHRPASARCSHESPPVARLNEGAISCALTREDGAFLGEESIFLAGATLASSAHFFLAGWRSRSFSCAVGGREAKIFWTNHE